MRKDTGQTIDTRALLQTERQRPLPLKGIDGGKEEPAPKRTRKPRETPAG